MGHWNVLHIHRIHGTASHCVRGQMGDNLMAMKVEIDPVIGTSSFRAAEQVTIEATRCRKIIDGKGEMERRKCHRP